MPSEIALMRWARRANNRNWDRPPGRIAGAKPLEAGAPMRSLKPSDRRTIMASLLALSLAGPAFADSGRSRDFVAEIYRVAGGPSGDGSDGEAIFADEANRKRFLSHGLRAAIDAMDRRTPKGDAPDLDFDPISSGNDPNFHDLRITVECEQAACAVVIADFVSDQTRCTPCCAIFWCARMTAGRSTTSSPAARTNGASESSFAARRENNGLDRGAWQRAYASTPAGEPTYATRIILVAPGVPSGTPATMMMRCPALAKPSRNAIWQARSTMSS
jgi:hypothetical protein